MNLSITLRCMDPCIFDYGPQQMTFYQSLSYWNMVSFSVKSGVPLTHHLGHTCFCDWARRCLCALPKDEKSMPLWIQGIVWVIYSNNKIGHSPGAAITLLLEVLFNMLSGFWFVVESRVMTPFDEALKNRFSAVYVFIDEVKYLLGSQRAQRQDEVTGEKSGFNRWKKRRMRHRRIDWAKRPSTFHLKWA